VVKDTHYMRIVKQFTFNLWKDDQDVPENAEAIQTMLDAVIKWQPNLDDSRPILFHCEWEYMGVLHLFSDALGNFAHSASGYADS